MNCTTLADRLTDFLEGELTPAEESAAIAHLSTAHPVKGCSLTPERSSSSLTNTAEPS